MRTSELTDLALDWVVAQFETPGVTVKEFVEHYDEYGTGYGLWSTDWSQGGPIIAREKICLGYNEDTDQWFADRNQGDNPADFGVAGPTALIAAMRCFVASKLGDEVDIPKELLT